MPKETTKMPQNSRENTASSVPMKNVAGSNLQDELTTEIASLGKALTPLPGTQQLSQAPCDSMENDTSKLLDDGEDFPMIVESGPDQGDNDDS
jgi:hypothetical protein